MLLALAPHAQARTFIVIVRDFDFAPGEITVGQGDVVRWSYPLTGAGTAAHNVTADDGSFSSNDFGRGGSYRHAFHERGVFRYHCTNHGGPGGKGMSGIVRVGPPSSPDPKPTPPGSMSPSEEPSGASSPTGTASSRSADPSEDPSNPSPTGSPGDDPSGQPTGSRDEDDQGIPFAPWLLLASLLAAGAGLTFWNKRRT